MKKNFVTRCFSNISHRGLNLALLALVLIPGWCLPSRAGELTGWTSGGKSVLIIPVGFTDAPAPGGPSEGWTNLMANDNAYFIRQSFSNYWFSSFAVCPVDMGVSSTNYKPYSGVKWITSEFLPDIRAKARLAGYNADDYDLEIVHTYISSESAVGNAVTGGKGIWVNMSNGYSRISMVTAHEIGHNLGAFHARGFSSSSYLYPSKTGSWLADYGNPFDKMGFGTGMQADFCAYSKNAYGWLPDSMVANAVTSSTYRIHAFDQGVATVGNHYAMKIARDGANTYWLEFRQAFTNNPWSMNGLLVLWGAEDVLSSAGAPQLMDMTPGSRGGIYPDPVWGTGGATIFDAPLLLGRTFSDVNRDLHITPVRMGGTSPESLDVVVNHGPFPGNRPPTLSLAGTTLTPAPGEAVTFTATASDPDGDTLAYFWEFDDPAAPADSGIRPFGSGRLDPDTTLRTAATNAWASNGLFLVRCTATDMKGGRTTGSAMVTVGDGSGLILSGVVKDQAGNPVAGAVVNNWNLGSPVVPFGATNFVASGETASNGFYMIHVQSNTTYKLMAHHDGHSFLCNTPGGSKTGTVPVGVTSVANVDFTRVINTCFIGGIAYLEGIGKSYTPATYGPLTIHDTISGQNASMTTGGTWSMAVPEGPVALTFTTQPGHSLRYGFLNPYEAMDSYSNLHVFVDIPGDVPSVGFGTSGATGYGAAKDVAIPIVLTLPDGYTNTTWGPNLWLKGVVDAASTAKYGVDYRMRDMELRFTNSTSVFTNYLVLNVISNGATHNRAVVLKLVPLTSASHMGVITTYTYTIMGLAVPAGVSATDGTYTDSVGFAWGAVPGALGYRLWRNTHDDANTATHLVALTNLFWADMTVSPGTTYWYWVQATNAEVASPWSASDSGYAALGAPPSPGQVAAGDAVSTIVLPVTWHTSAAATAYEVWRSATDDAGTATRLTAPDVGTTNYNDATAAPGARYYYWVKARNEWGTSGYSSPSAPGVRGLTPPAAVSASDNSHAWVWVRWSASDGATAYQVWRNTTPSASGASNVAAIAGMTNWADVTGTEGAIRYYWVKATTIHAVSGLSASNAGSRAAWSLVATSGTYPDKVRLTWPGVEGAAGYVVRRGTNLIGATKATTYDDAAGNFGVSYTYSVQATNAMTNAWSSPASGFRSVLSATNVTASEGVFSDRVRVMWAAIAGATGYEVWRSTSTNAGTAVKLADTSLTSFDDMAAAPGVDYAYWVKSRYNAESSSFGAHAIGWRSSSAPTLPSAPIRVSATDGTYADRVQVEWTAVVGASGYQVWRNATDASASADLLAATSATAWDDVSASADVTYWYWVKATNASGASGFSASDAGYRTAAPTPPAARHVNNDYDGDALSDLAVFDGNTGRWYVRTVSGTIVAWGTPWGWPGALPVTGDYDNDGISDLAVFDNNTGNWYVLSVDGRLLAWSVPWGWPGAVPVSGDYDGDEVSDLAVFDSNTGNWYVLSVDGRLLVWSMPWGWPGAVPVSGDYDADGLADLGVFDSITGNWYVRTVAGGILVWSVPWGWPGAISVPGDYDGDEVSDLAVFDNNTGNWYVLSVDGRLLVWSVPWGWPGALPPGERL